MIKFADSDVVNPDDCIFAHSYNPHNVHPFILHDHGFVVAVVFADCLQDAIDIAVDKGKMDRYALSRKEVDEYERDNANYCLLGNAGEAFDIESLSVEELPPPKFSLVKLYNDE